MSEENFDLLKKILVNNFAFLLILASSVFVTFKILIFAGGNIQTALAIIELNGITTILIGTLETLVPETAYLFSLTLLSLLLREKVLAFKDRYPGYRPVISITLLFLILSLLLLLKPHHLLLWATFALLGTAVYIYAKISLKRLKKNIKITQELLEKPYIPETDISHSASTEKKIVFEAKKLRKANSLHKRIETRLSKIIKMPIFLEALGQILPVLGITSIVLSGFFSLLVPWISPQIITIEGRERTAYPLIQRETTAYVFEQSSHRIYQVPSEAIDYRLCSSYTGTLGKTMFEYFWGSPLPKCP